MTIFVQIQSVIMPKARRTSYNLAFKLKVIAEAEAVENNSEIAREYGISESIEIDGEEEEEEEMEEEFDTDSDEDEP